MIKFAYATFFAVLLLCEKAYAEDVTPGHVKIEFIPRDKKDVNDKAIVKHWKKGCALLGQSLSAGNGPWGFGIFSSFNCQIGKKTVFGKGKESQWSILIKSTENDVTVIGSFKGVEQAKVVLPPSESFLQFLVDGEFVDNLALSILDGFPAGLLVTKARVTGNPPLFAGRHFSAGQSRDFKFKVPQPPEEIILYRLVWDDGQKAWQSQVAGSAKKLKIVPPVTTKKKKRSLLKGGQVVYQISPEAMELLSQGPLWGQNAEGPGARSQELGVELGKDLGNLNKAAESGYLKEYLDGKAGILDQIFKTAASGYLGMRYGLQILPSEGALGQLLGKTGIFSLLLEIRGGPVKGLRYYYDKLPEQRLEIEGTKGEKFTTNLAFARHVIGYSFGFDTGLFINRISIDPKFGMWNFDASLPVLQDEQGKVSRVEKFSLGKTFSLALEVGLEKTSSWFTLRGWYAIDSGFSLLKSGGKVTSNRLGIDSYFTAGPKFSVFGLGMKTALMGFYVFENVSIRKGTDGVIEPGVEAISGLTYSAGYAGGGVALSW